MSSDRTFDLKKNTLALVNENSAMSASWWCWRKRHFGIAIAALGNTFAIGMIATCRNYAVAQSQIVPDGSLGAERSEVISNFNGLPVEVIQGGAIRGGNLFHSFGEFNVAAGRGAYFFSPSAAIETILARVTGSNPSQILGTLGTFGNSNPNLFLMNPNGIIFGSNSSLDVGGSFVATTANAIAFNNQGFFSASTPNLPTLLTVNPSAFLFNQIAAKPITNQSLGGLKVPDGQSLLLLGGEVKLEGGVLVAPGGRVELGGVAGTGTVGLNVDGNNLTLGFPDNVARADIALINGAGIGVLAEGGGNIVINAQNLEVSGESLLIAGIGQGLGSVGAQAGDITLNATGAITVAQSRIYNLLQSEAVGNGGNINLSAESLSLDQSELAAVTIGRGNAGRVVIQANGSVSLTNASTIFNTVEFGAEGNSGGINITAGSVSFTNGGELQASTNGRGNAGNVVIQAHDISFDGVNNDGFSSGIFSTVKPTGVGKAGDIQIITSSLSLTNGAEVLSNTRGLGKAGNVTVLSDSISIDGVGSNQENSGIYTTVAASVGTGGDISITTGSLSMTNGGELNTSTYAQGNAGNLIIIAHDSIFIDGVGSNGYTSGLGSGVGIGGIGKGGNIEVTTRSLSITNGGNIDVSTFGGGDAGNVTILSTDTVSLDGVGSDGSPSGVFSVVRPEAMGNGGNVKIATRSLSLTNGATVASSTAGRGNAGNVILEAADAISFDGVSRAGFSTGTFSTVEPGAVGKGGNVYVTTGLLFLTNGALLNASTFGQGDAGNVTITARDAIFFNGVGSNGVASGVRSRVASEAVGNGGNISVTARSVSLTNGATLLASSEGSGAAGNIEVSGSSIRLDNKATISADTVAGQGNINLDTRDLVLRRGSQITTNATGTANGGNITINTDNLVAVPQEDSDISANAEESFGGRVIINAQGIFGTQFSPQNTPLSDITATSALGPSFSGIVQINTPDVDPSRGLANLPTEPVDASNQIAQTCSAGGKVAQNEFIITGRGGLPDNPSETLSNDAVWTDLRPIPQTAATRSSSQAAQLPTNSKAVSLVEAQGWVINNQGQVVLTASATAVIPQSSRLTPAQCHVP
ncbi:MAG TPA: S-layer family protein [Coleofasciculaceae cyanobacterium]|jgi:filamentous hemagglutinin family protein